MLLQCNYISNMYCNGCYHNGDHLAEDSCEEKECLHAPALFIATNTNCNLCTHQAVCSQYDPGDIIDLTTEANKCKAYKDLRVNNTKCIPSGPPHTPGVCDPAQTVEHGKIKCLDCGRYYNEDTEEWELKALKRFKTNWEE